jgi:hypothetical protein
MSFTVKAALCFINVMFYTSDHNQELYSGAGVEAASNSIRLCNMGKQAAWDSTDF